MDSHTEWPKVHVVRCGVDAAFLAAGPQPISDNRRLVCVGRLAEEKGQLMVLEALAALAAEGVSFEVVLAGDGPLRPVIEGRLRDLGLESTVRITGWLSNDAVRAELLSARVLLLPSFAEGLPVALMEALALGRPAISTYVAGIPELLQNGVSGWLIPAGSVEQLVTAIKQALETPASRLADMGRAGAAAAAPPATTPAAKRRASRSCSLQALNERETSRGRSPSAHLLLARAILWPS